MCWGQRRSVPGGQGRMRVPSRQGGPSRGVVAGAHWCVWVLGCGGGGEMGALNELYGRFIPESWTLNADSKALPALTPKAGGAHSISGIQGSVIGG